MDFSIARKVYFNVFHGGVHFFTFYGRSLFGHEQRDCRADLHFLIYSVAFLLSGLEAQI